MDIFTTKPVREIEATALRLALLNKEIKVSPHALDHLSQKQRKVFKEEDILHMTQREEPRKVYVQRNGRYACYYRKSDGYRKLIIEIGKTVTIITFMDISELPRVRFEHE